VCARVCKKNTENSKSNNFSKSNRESALSSNFNNNYFLYILGVTTTASSRGSNY